MMVLVEMSTKKGVKNEKERQKTELKSETEAKTRGEILYGDMTTGGETAMKTDSRLHSWTELQETPPGSKHETLKLTELFFIHSVSLQHTEFPFKCHVICGCYIISGCAA